MCARVCLCVRVRACVRARALPWRMSAAGDEDASVPPFHTRRMARLLQEYRCVCASVVKVDSKNTGVLVVGIT